MNESSDLLSNIVGIGFEGNSSVFFTRGVSGDLFSGLGFFTSGGGANNQVSRDKLSITNADVKPAMTYGITGGTAGVRLDSSAEHGKIILTGFGFEAISTIGNRVSVMEKVMGYFDGSILVGVGDQSSDHLPYTYTLNQNYPNPFNPTTEISFDIQNPVHVSLKIFDLTGRVMETLLDERKPTGNYSVTWTGDGYSSGIYFYQLIAGEFIETKKMVFLR